MERKEFIEILREKDYPYEEIGERIIVGLYRGDSLVTVHLYLLYGERVSLLNFLFLFLRFLV
jgi:hypothetical protein